MSGRGPGRPRSRVQRAAGPRAERRDREGTGLALDRTHSHHSQSRPRLRTHTGPSGVAVRTAQTHQVRSRHGRSSRSIPIDPSRVGRRRANGSASGRVGGRASGVQVHRWAGAAAARAQLTPAAGARARTHCGRDTPRPLRSPALPESRPPSACRTARHGPRSARRPGARVRTLTRAEAGRLTAHNHRLGRGSHQGSYIATPLTRSCVSLDGP